jgi:hypothetical protein
MYIVSMFLSVCACVAVGNLSANQVPAQMSSSLPDVALKPVRPWLKHSSSIHTVHNGLRLELFNFSNLSAGQLASMLHNFFNPPTSAFFANCQRFQLVAFSTSTTCLTSQLEKFVYLLTASTFIVLLFLQLFSFSDSSTFSTLTSYLFNFSKTVIPFMLHCVDIFA